MQAKMSSRGTSVLSITTLAGSGEIKTNVSILPATKINPGDTWLKAKHSGHPQRKEGSLSSNDLKVV